jgi:hypothetical protein
LSTVRVTFGLNPGPSTGRARYNCTPCTPLNPALDITHEKEDFFSGKNRPKKAHSNCQNIRTKRVRKQFLWKKCIGCTTSSLF